MEAKDLILPTLALCRQAALDFFRQNDYPKTHEYLVLCNSLLPKALQAEFNELTGETQDSELKFICRENFGSLDKAIERFKELDWQPAKSTTLDNVTSSLRQFRESTVEQLVYDGPETIVSPRKKLKDLAETGQLEYLYRTIGQT